MPLSLPPRRPAAPAWNPRARDEPSLPLIAEHRHPINNRAVRPGSLAIQGGMKVTDGAAAASRRGRGRRHPGARGPRRTFSRSWGGAPGGKARTGVAPRSLSQAGIRGPRRAARPKNNIIFAAAVRGRGRGRRHPGARGHRRSISLFLGGRVGGKARAGVVPRSLAQAGIRGRRHAARPKNSMIFTARAGLGAAALRGSRAPTLHFPSFGGAVRDRAILTIGPFGSLPP